MSKNLRQAGWWWYLPFIPALSTQEAEGNRSVCVQGQPGLQELVSVQAPKLQEKPCHGSLVGYGHGGCGRVCLRVGRECVEGIGRCGV